MFKLPILPCPSTHTTLFWHPYDVVLTLWTLYGHRNNVVCLLGWQLISLVQCGPVAQWKSKYLRESHGHFGLILKVFVGLSTPPIAEHSCKFKFLLYYAFCFTFAVTCHTRWMITNKIWYLTFPFISKYGRKYQSRVVQCA